MHRRGGIKPPFSSIGASPRARSKRHPRIEAHPLAFARASDYSLFQFEVTIGSRSSTVKNSRAGVDPPAAAGGAQYRGGCVSWVCHVSHDGRGAATRAGGGRLSRELVLGFPGAQPDARRLGGMLAARYHSAGIFLPGGRGAALFDWQPPGERRHVRQDVRARGVALDFADRTGRLSAVHAQHTDLLHVRRYAVADRAGVSDSVFPRIPAAEMAMDRARRYSDWLLGGLGALSPARSGVRLAIGRRAPGLAALLLGLRRALEQERQLGERVRPM